MDIGTQINIALGVLAFLAAQAFVAAGYILFRVMREPAWKPEASETEERPRGAVPRHV